MTAAFSHNRLHCSLRTGLGQPTSAGRRSGGDLGDHAGDGGLYMANGTNVLSR